VSIAGGTATELAEWWEYWRVLAGLLGNALAGWWWLAPIAGLFVGYVAIREGCDSWRDDSRCAAGSERGRVRERKREI
jgi:hypothetical protein